MGIAIAERARARGWEVTLLLGPTALKPTDARVRVEPFRTTEDLRRLLERLAPETDVLIMAAAVADYRPKARPEGPVGKIKRGSAALVLELEPTPDLLAGVAEKKRPGQVMVGFALEPRERLLEDARAKLLRKGLDLIVANPLETMDSATVEATILGPEGVLMHTGPGTQKEAFADRLLDAVAGSLAPTGAGTERA